MKADTSAVAVDVEWMQRALVLADRAASAGEVPVGAIVVCDGEEIGAGWNAPVGSHDPTAHAEILALRAAATELANYRLPGATLYTTMEPCPMCAGAIVHARLARVVYAAKDPRWGAVDSVFEILGSKRLNHYVDCRGGVLAEESQRRLKAFFEARR